MGKLCLNDSMASEITTTMNIKEILFKILKTLERIPIYQRNWLTPEQAGEYLGLSTNTIYQYVSKRKIPFRKIPNSTKLLFKRSDIDQWIEGKKINSESESQKIAGEIWKNVS